MLLGALLALVSAFSFSVNFILVRRGFADAGATAAQGAFITVLLGVPFGLAAVVITGQLFNFGDISLNGYLLLAAAGIVHFGIGRYCNYRGIAAIGAPRAATIQAIAVPYSVVMAMALLGERPTLLMLVGIALILGSPALMIDRGKRKGEGTKAAPAVEMRMVEGYTFSLLASVGYGTSPILIRAALEDATG